MLLSRFVHGFFFQAEDGIRDSSTSRGLGDVYKRQLESSGVVPTHRQVVVERFVDELGDDRICILAPFGTAINAPWAMTLESVLSNQHGFDVQALWSDDGISLTLVNDGEPLEVDIDRWLPDPDDIEDLIIEQLSPVSYTHLRAHET